MGVCRTPKKGDVIKVQPLNLNDNAPFDIVAALHNALKERRVASHCCVLVFPQGTDLESAQCLAHVNAGVAEWSEGRPASLAIDMTQSYTRLFKWDLVTKENVGPYKLQIFLGNQI